MNLAISIDIFHWNLLENFWDLRSWIKQRIAWDPKDVNAFWALKALSGLGSLSQLKQLPLVFEKFFIAQQCLVLRFLKLPSFPSPVFVNTVLFFPLKPLLYLWRYLTQKAYQAVANPQRLWHGLRLLALDSTALNLPESLWPQFGSQKGNYGRGPVQSHMAVLYDLLTRMPLRVKPGHSHLHADQQLLKKLLYSFGPGILLLMDAGFYGFGIFSQLLHKKTHFLIPLIPQAKPKLIKAFGPNDGLYEIKHHRRRKPPFKNQRTMIVRILVLHRPGFRPRRLVSSLVDPQAFPSSDIAVLYHERWHIETFFRDFKHTLCAQSWHAKTPHAFYVELIFFMLLTCLTRLVMAQSDKVPSALSFEKSFYLVKRILSLSAFVPVASWNKLYAQLLQLVGTYKIDVRPNRTFERNVAKKRQQNRKPKEPVFYA